MNPPQIKTLVAKQLIGIRMSMSLMNNKTPLLWGTFMPRRKEVENTTGSGLYSVQILPAGYYENFDPTKEFEKWAAVEVNNSDRIPAGMESMNLPEGLYAVFLHKGGPAEGPKSFRYIMNEWLPASEYKFDDRPQFELLGEKYKHNAPDSEEEIWIPIRKK